MAKRKKVDVKEREIQNRGKNRDEQQRSKMKRISRNE